MEPLFRSLSPNGNSTLKTLLAVLKSVGMRLSVEPENQVRACGGVGGWFRPTPVSQAVLSWVKSVAGAGIGDRQLSCSPMNCRSGVVRILHLAAIAVIESSLLDD